MSETTAPAPTPLLSNKVYDLLKTLVTIILPGAGTLYFTLAGIWGWPNAEAVVGSIAAVTVFLGLVLGLSTKTYKNAPGAYTGVVNQDDDGVLDAGYISSSGVNEDTGLPVLQLRVTEHPEDVLSASEVRFRVE